MPLVLRAHSLWKSYAAGVAGCSARIWVLRAASLEVHEGECIAILGARGAGTTTLLQCLAGLRRVDAGTIEHRQRPHLVCAPHASDTRQAAPRVGDIVLVDDTAHPAGATPIARAVHEPAERGATTIIATHELSSVRRIVDRALLLRDGHLTPLPLRSGSRRVAERAGTAPSLVIEASQRRPKAVNRSP
ncbi:MAG: ATP-binding cassette domain-containing protein [Gemmatimonadetes bacterium]|nr:ATP-binding cassette domain-containing protein [Gemmatimonadota bacterium]